MTFDEAFSFTSLYNAHKRTRRGKRDKREVIEFEINLSESLTVLSNELKSGTYKVSPYRAFTIYEPKERVIHALSYRDRVVQEALCKNIIAPLFEPRLIHANAACRVRKGTHFAINSVSDFLRDYYKTHGTNEGYVLRCDVRKFFDSVNHDVLKGKIKKVFHDKRTLALLNLIIDSYETTANTGLPVGNQTSQWFGIYYLDSFDRMVKEKLGIKYYSRYMDDAVLISDSKEKLKECRDILKFLLKSEDRMDFNQKTQIAPLKNGIEYLGWHYYLTKNGKVIKRVKTQTKKKYKRKLKYYKVAYAERKVEIDKITATINSYIAHLSHGDTHALQSHILGNFILRREVPNKEVATSR